MSKCEVRAKMKTKVSWSTYVHNDRNVQFFLHSLSVYETIKKSERQSVQPLVDALCNWGCTWRLPTYKSMGKWVCFQCERNKVKITMSKFYAVKIHREHCVHCVNLNWFCCVHAKRLFKCMFRQLSSSCYACIHLLVYSFEYESKRCKNVPSVRKLWKLIAAAVDNTAVSSTAPAVTATSSPLTPHFVDAYAAMMLIHYRLILLKASLIAQHMVVGCSVVINSNHFWAEDKQSHSWSESESFFSRHYFLFHLFVCFFIQVEIQCSIRKGMCLSWCECTCGVNVINYFVACYENEVECIICAVNCNKVVGWRMQRECVALCAFCCVYQFSFGNLLVSVMLCCSTPKPCMYVESDEINWTTTVFGVLPQWNSSKSGATEFHQE